MRAWTLQSLPLFFAGIFLLSLAKDVCAILSLPFFFFFACFQFYVNKQLVSFCILFRALKYIFSVVSHLFVVRLHSFDFSHARIYLLKLA